MLGYRDPLFSVIMFLSMIAIAILVTNFFGRWKEKNKMKDLKEFVEKFDFLDNKEINSIFSGDISVNALIFLAIAFEKEGNYEKSLNIYIVLLNHIKENEKYKVLQNMAQVYLKAGFLHKSRESLLEILKAHPRKIDALNLLFIVDDKLKNYDEMDNIIEILEELEIEVDKKTAYLEYKKAIFKNDKIRMRYLIKKYPALKRDYINYFINIDIKEIFNHISNDEIYEMIDIFWKIDYLPLQNEALKQIQAAKKELVIDEEAKLFELEVLKYTPKGLADLEFEYICENCKHLSPLYDDRCPHCKELFTLKVEVEIVKKSTF